MKVHKCKPCNNNNLCKCNRWWQIWSQTLIPNIIKPNRWQCFNRCSLWLLWCKKWWFLISQHNSSNNNLRLNLKNRIHKITCSQTYSKPLLNQDHLLTSIQEEHISNSHLRAPITLLLLRVQTAINSHHLTPSVQGLLQPDHPWQFNTNSSNRITLLICLID